VGDLILSARPPYFIEDLAGWPWYARWLQWLGPELLRTSVLRAAHGFPAGTPGHSGIFYVWGPAAEPGLELGPVRAVDVHATVMALLGLEPGEPQDGEVQPLVSTAGTGPTKPAMAVPR
jgi:hypothetical protein